METKTTTEAKTTTETQKGSDKQTSNEGVDSKSLDLFNIYQKQLNLVFDLNNKILNSMLGSKNKSSETLVPLLGFYKIFFNGGNTEKSTFKPFVSMNGQQEPMKNMLQELSDAYNKQLNLSIETNKELFTEMNKQFTNILKTNEELWKGIAKTNESSTKEEISKKSEKKEMASH